MTLPAKGEPPDSKLTEALLAEIRTQLDVRSQHRTWVSVATRHGISRENLFRHIRKVKTGLR